MRRCSRHADSAQTEELHIGRYYDTDGLVDLLVCNVGVYTSDKKGTRGKYVGLPDAFHGHLHPDRFEHPVLYKNMGHSKFKDVTAEVGLNPYGWSGDATFADVNGDGWPDVFFLNMKGTDHYFENVGGKKFVEKTAEYFPRTPWGAMGVKFFDYDNDGRMDLIVTDMHSDMMTEIRPTEEKEKVTSPAPEAKLGSASEQVHLRQRFLSQHGRRQIRGDLRQDRRGAALAVGRQRGRYQRGWMGGHFCQRGNELSISLWDQFDAAE
jgi:enediyne biosynthesis protein E4